MKYLARVYANSKQLIEETPLAIILVFTQFNV